MRERDLEERPKRHPRRGERRIYPDKTTPGGAGKGRSHPAFHTKKMTNDATLIEPLPTSLSGPDFKSALVRREDCRRRLRFVQPKIASRTLFLSSPENLQACVNRAHAASVTDRVPST